MISIVSLDLDEFKKYMSDKYSADIFNAAFFILQKHSELMLDQKDVEIEDFEH